MKKKSKEVAVFTEQEVTERIYTVRGKRVMLDRDLAELYQVKTQALNQAVKRNRERFPKDFMYQLSEKETENWISQIVISNKVKMGLRKKPFAFTFKGISMLSSVLRSKLAIQRNIYIMRVFEKAQELKAEAPSIQDKLKFIEHQVSGDKKRIDTAFDAINFLLDQKKNK